VDEYVPSPADPAPQTAEEFLAEVSEQDGRIFRMQEPPRVFIVTTNGDLAARLLRRGAKSFLPQHLDPIDLAPRSSYRRTKVSGVEEWDIEIAMVPGIEGSLWEAAGGYRNGQPK
jgi:hypothetical protein